MQFQFGFYLVTEKIQEYRQKQCYYLMQVASKYRYYVCLGMDLHNPIGWNICIALEGGISQPFMSSVYVVPGDLLELAPMITKRRHVHEGDPEVYMHNLTAKGYVDYYMLGDKTYHVELDAGVRVPLCQKLVELGILRAAPECGIARDFGVI